MLRPIAAAALGRILREASRHYDAVDLWTNDLTFMHPPSRLLATLTASILLHGFVLAALAGRSLTPSRPGAIETLQVMLAGFSTDRAVVTRITGGEQRMQPQATTRQNGSAPLETGSSIDSPLVEARHDVAGLDNPKPPYPLSARRRGLQGRVLVTAHVRADGQCDAVQVRQSSGHALLDDAARDTVRRWHFLPARRGDKPTDSWVEVPIVFRLDS